MSSKVQTFLRSIFSTINKSDAELDLEKSINYLSDIEDAYQMASNVIPDGNFTDHANADMVKRFYDELNRMNPAGVRLTINRNFLTDMVTLLQNVKLNGNLVQSRLRDFKSNVITTTAIAADQAAILRAVPHYFFITRYAVAFLNFIVANEVKVINNNPTNIPPKMVQSLKDEIYIFVALLSSYGADPKDFKARVDIIPETVLTQDQNDRVDDFQVDYKIDLTPTLPNGFIGSPIYSLRSGIAKWQADRYHAAEDMKRLLQLRLNYYESLRNSGNSNAEVEKEIEYLQGQVTKVSAKIDKMEASIR